MAPSLKAVRQWQVGRHPAVVMINTMVTSSHSTVIGAKADNNTALQETVEV